MHVILTLFAFLQQKIISPVDQSSKPEGNVSQREIETIGSCNPESTASQLISSQISLQQEQQSCVTYANHNITRNMGHFAAALCQWKIAAYFMIIIQNSKWQPDQLGKALCHTVF